MKRIVSVAGIVCCLTCFTFGQTMELGLNVGVTNFLGDLGKKEPTGKTYFGDIEASLFRQTAGVFFRNSFNGFFAMKASLTYGMWEGDDRLANTKEFMDDAWFRNYRNLHFRSHFMEVAITGEVNVMRYMPGSSRNWIAPYAFAGVGFVYFNPKAKYNGEWVALQPLGTEGQGMPQYPDRKKYSRVQPVIPIGIGLKANVMRYITVGVEFGHRFTFTDYLDDVSTTYVSEQEFIDFYGPEKGALAYALSRRSHELDPEETYGSITKPGEVRGNPGGKDAYLFTTVSVAYKFANQFSEYSYSHKRNVVRKKGFTKKRVNKYRRFIRSRTW
ncbi:MAG: hypothetical protein KatS3mg031_1077 [Chitinophagales bacterium]|nr:MAG: hypothetical protein KatS3mg031_1077 [Chitinophagales bacterium]